jgi:hypothetical protein
VLKTTEYIDTTDSPGLGAAIAVLQTGTPYYYVVKSVAVDGDESVASAEVSARATALNSNVAGSMTNVDASINGCFIQTARGTTIWDFGRRIWDLYKD